MNGEAVPEVVYPWLMARTIRAAKTNPVAQCPIVVLKRVRLDASAAPRRKERSLFAGCRMAALVLKQEALKLRSKWQKTRLAELTGEQAAVYEQILVSLLEHNVGQMSTPGLLEALRATDGPGLLF